ncbi:Putative secretion accessory protein EsaA/YueB [Staphylococcus aureus]|nr:Putative secretion accessory protein EsaA/YueB [Staphylococcus aureus]CXY17118.1 Putative secretion accessory protein EsaA/YueB [Staphylococcus aureus]
MKKKNWIYALIVTLIIIIAIVSMIFFVQTKYGDQSEKGSQSVSNKNNKIHIAIVTRINQRHITVKRLSWVKHLLKG